MVPQCGFSAMAATLYAGRVVTLGTLVAVFLSTSDEMLPLLLAEQVPVQTMAMLLASKALIALVTGFIVAPPFAACVVTLARMRRFAAPCWEPRPTRPT